MELEQLERVERHVRSLETAYERERQQRDHLEKKYARLKRRFVRLERAHAKLLLETSHADASSAPGVSSPRSPEAASDLIDLTSPTARRSPLHEPWASAPSSASEAPSRQSPLAVSARRALPEDDLCGESPRSSDREPLERPLRFARTDSMPSATSRSRRQLDFVWTRGPAPPPPSPPRPSRHPATSPLAPPESLPLPRPRPRPVAQSPERRAPSRELDPSPATRRLHSESEDERSLAHLLPSASSMWPSERLPRSPFPSRGRSISSSSSTAPASSSPSPPRSPVRRDDDEAASLELARYLQEQENIAAYEEYEARLRLAREQLPPAREATGPAASAMAPYSPRRQEHWASSAMLAQPNDIDPDNMTYEELLQLGEQVGDVKKERWRQVAVQVISSLPTHRWSGGNQADVSCIICQCSFEHNDMALTLPCAHVFHEGCVDGWIRENNSCPLCKREIANV